MSGFCEHGTEPLGSARNILTSSGTVSFPGRTLLPGVSVLCYSVFVWLRYNCEPMVLCVAFCALTENDFDTKGCLCGVLCSGICT